jgi:hypothetical protein
MEKSLSEEVTPEMAEALPTYWYKRRSFNKFLLESDGYKEAIEKGLPFFTSDELLELESKYKNGITWKEIDTELSKKGMIFKKSNFRKYIQEGRIPKAENYRASEKGREALYPSNTIEHINCIHYCYRIAGKKGIDSLLSLFSDQTISAKDAIEERLHHGSLFSGVLTYLKGISFEDDDIEQALHDVLRQDPDFLEKVLSGLAEISDVFNKKISEWSKLLERYELTISEHK